VRDRKTRVPVGHVQLLFWVRHDRVEEANSDPGPSTPAVNKRVQPCAWTQLPLCGGQAGPPFSPKYNDV
jgi:hypothetical protein